MPEYYTKGVRIWLCFHPSTVGSFCKINMCDIGRVRIIQIGWRVKIQKIPIFGNLVMPMDICSTTINILGKKVAFKNVSSMCLGVQGQVLCIFSWTCTVLQQRCSRKRRKRQNQKSRYKQRNLLFQWITLSKMVR